MSTELLGITLQEGLLLIDIPFYSPILSWVLGLWFWGLVISFVLRLIKLIPFL